MISDNNKKDENNFCSTDSWFKGESYKKTKSENCETVNKAVIVN